MLIRYNVFKEFETAEYAAGFVEGVDFVNDSSLEVTWAIGNKVYILDEEDDSPVVEMEVSEPETLIAN